MSELEKLWNDKMDIYRSEPVTDPDNGSTKNQYMLKHTDVKCHYSKTSLAQIGTDGVPTIANKYTLFCNIDVDIKEGDRVIVTQKNLREIALSVGEGFPYFEHWEFSVTRRGTI